MISCIAGLIAAALAWIGNVLIVKRWAESGVIWIVPLFEELVKTMTALLLGGSIIYVHGIFGLIEAIHDYTSSRRLGLWSGLAGLTSHWIFGQVTQYTYTYTRMWIIGIVATALLHTYFNYMMIRFLNRKKH
jgi:succinate dehydrogenase hydrophobic anchor subunit